MSTAPEKCQLYNEHCEFINCSCDDTQKTNYSISHSTKPLPLPQKLVESIETLLWYTPNVKASAQTFKNEYLKNPIFDDAVITYFLRYMKLKNEDICFIKGACIPIELVAPFEKKICRCCNKIILLQNDYESKFSCLLRHLRNCIAHGQFNILCDDSFIGFDKTFVDKKEEYTAVLKLRIESVHDFCIQLSKYPDFTVSQIFQHALHRDYYTVVATLTGEYNFTGKDSSEELVFARKNNVAVRINCSRYLYEKDDYIVKIIDEYNVCSDAQFDQDTKYTDVYYCEKERKPIKRVSASKYIIGKQGLIQIAEGIDINDMIMSL